MASISAYLSVWTTSLTVHDLATTLGPEGRVSFQGDMRDPPRPFPKANGWSITIWDEDSCDPAAVLGRLLHKIAPLKSAIGRLKREAPDLDIRIGVTIRPPLPVVALHFVAEQIGVIAAFGASFDIDHFDD